MILQSVVGCVQKFARIFVRQPFHCVLVGHPRMARVLGRDCYILRPRPAQKIIVAKPIKIPGTANATLAP